MTKNKPKQKGIRFEAIVMWDQVLNPSKPGEFQGKVIPPKYTADYIVSDEKYLKKLKDNNVGIATKQISKGEGLKETVALSYEKEGFKGKVYRATKPVYYKYTDDEGKEVQKRTIPPRVVGAGNMEWPKDKRIGNGSKVLVEAILRWDDTNKCNRLNLQQVKVLEHVSYTPNVEYDDDEVDFDDFEGASIASTVEAKLEEPELPDEGMF